MKKMCQILLWKVENITYTLRVFDSGDLKARNESPWEFLELLVGKFELANIWACEISLLSVFTWALGALVLNYNDGLWAFWHFIT
jgi:hypothetical protein